MKIFQQEGQGVRAPQGARPREIRPDRQGRAGAGAAPAKRGARAAAVPRSGAPAARRRPSFRRTPITLRTSPGSRTRTRSSTGTSKRPTSASAAACPRSTPGLAPGQTVVDLGSGAGNDVFIARAAVGETGRVIGVDMTPEMIAKARENAGAPRRSATSSSALAISKRCPSTTPRPTSSSATASSTSSPTSSGPSLRSSVSSSRAAASASPTSSSRASCRSRVRNAAEFYVGCVAGALDRKDYVGLIRKAGFAAIEVKSSKKLDLPDEILLEHIDADALSRYRSSGATVLSITVVGERPQR